MLIPRAKENRTPCEIHPSTQVDSIAEKVQCAYDSDASGLIIRHEHGLQELPLCIKVLRNQLELLLVDNNYNLREIPGFIGDFSRLRVLDASYCRINRVHPRLACLRKLEHLNLANNQIEYLTFEASRLKSLEKLNMENNKMRVLPGGLLFLSRLKEVTLENNPFYDAVEIEGALDVKFAPSLTNVECSNCWIPTRNYRVFISFHRLAQHVELPFAFYTCSDICEAQVKDRLDRYNALQRAKRKP